MREQRAKQVPFRRGVRHGRLPARLGPSCEAVHRGPRDASSSSVSCAAATWASRGSRGPEEALKGPHRGPGTQAPAAGSRGLWPPRVPGPRQPHTEPCRDRRHLGFPPPYQKRGTKATPTRLARCAFGGRHPGRWVGTTASLCPFSRPSRRSQDRLAWVSRWPSLAQGCGSPRYEGSHRETRPSGSEAQTFTQSPRSQAEPPLQEGWAPRGLFRWLMGKGREEGGKRIQGSEHRVC